MKTLLFIGDSITDSHRLFLNTSHTLGDGYVCRLASQLPRHQFRLINRGHDGFTSADLLRCLNRDCISLHPDVVTILIGVNDIAVQLYGQCSIIPQQFQKTYHQILSRIRQALPHCRLILAEPFVFSYPQEYLAFHRYILEESQIIQTLSQEFSASFLPLQERMNQKNDALGRSPFTVDGIHLSDSGSELLANCWLSLAKPLLSDLL